MQYRVADCISLARIPTGFLACIVLIGIASGWWDKTDTLLVLVAALFFFGAIGDYLDGPVARRENALFLEAGREVPSHGDLLDPAVDKIEKIMAWSAMAVLGWVPVAAVALFLLRDALSAEFRNLLGPGSSGKADIWGKLKTWAMYIVLIAAPLAQVLGWDGSIPWSSAPTVFVHAVGVWGMVYIILLFAAIGVVGISLVQLVVRKGGGIKSMLKLETPHAHRLRDLVGGANFHPASGLEAVTKVNEVQPDLGGTRTD